MHIRDGQLRFPSKHAAGTCHGCQRQILLEVFSPRSTVYRYFQPFIETRVWDQIRHHLPMTLWEESGRETSQSVGIIDSHSVKGAKRGIAITRPGMTRACKSGGVKRHIATGTEGLLIDAILYPADVQDRDGAVDLLSAARTNLFPWLELIRADGDHRGWRPTEASVEMGKRNQEIIKHSGKAAGFEVLPRRWVAGRTIAWRSRNRRLAKPFECLLQTARAHLPLAMIQLMTRRLAKPRP